MKTPQARPTRGMYEHLDELCMPEYLMRFLTNTIFVRNSNTDRKRQGTSSLWATLAAPVSAPVVSSMSKCEIFNQTCFISVAHVYMVKTELKEKSSSTFEKPQSPGPLVENHPMTFWGSPVRPRMLLPQLGQAPAVASHTCPLWPTTKDPGSTSF